MSKEIICATVILIVIILSNIWVSHYIDGKLNHIVEKLDELENILNEEKYDEANEKLAEIEEYFNESEGALSCYIEHDELEKVITEFTELKAYVRFEKEEAFEALNKMSFIIRHIEEKDDIKIKNIF